MKKYGLIAATLLLSSTLFADNEGYKTEEVKAPTLYDGGFTTGMSLSTLAQNSFAGSLVNFGYYGTCWLVDVGVNYSRFSDTNVTNVLGHLGLRNRIYQNLFVNYGAVGLGRFVSDHDDSDNKWAVGAFLGLDYHLSRHFMISGKVYPYNYHHKSTHQAFANGILSFLYVY